MKNPRKTPNKNPLKPLNVVTNPLYTMDIPREEMQTAYEYLEAQAHCEEEAERVEDDIQDHLRRMHRNDTPDNRAIVFRHMGIY